MLLRIAVTGKYDTALVANTDNPIDAALALSLAWVKARIGFDNPGNALYSKTIKWDDKVNETTNHIRLLGSDQTTSNITGVKIKIEADEHKWAEEYLNSNGIKGKKIIGVHPGSSYKLRCKRWPVAKYKEVFASLATRNDLQIIVFLGPDEQEIETELKIGNNSILIAGGLTMGQTMGLISQCHVFLSNDSGLMHVAGALKIPVVAVFGPTDPVKNWGGYIGEAVKYDTECAPCYAERKYIACDSYKCIAGIKPVMVLMAMEKYL
jgi:ADP-heptose:LPS heptosyltransferase